MATKNIIGGVEYETVSTEAKHMTIEVLYSYKNCCTFDDEGKLDFLKQVLAKQQILFDTHTITANSPEKLVNHCSFYKTVAKWQRDIPNLDSMLS